ncbi:MAG: gamma-glutamyltransferase, partial [Pseudomonadota bacterium]
MHRHVLTYLTLLCLSLLLGCQDQDFLIDEPKAIKPYFNNKYDQYVDDEPKEEIAPESATGRTEKPLAYGREFMASTAHPRATQAAYDILKKGGSAVDAAIAAQMVLNVVEPQSSGIGGGGFLLHYDAETKALISYDGREIAPASATADMFLREEKDEKGNIKKHTMPFHVAATGGNAVAVPGLLDMLYKAHERHGKKSWASLFDPAIALANGGFELSPRLYYLIKYAKDYEAMSSDYKRYFKANGKQKDIGNIITNPALAESFVKIAQNGPDIFYKGAIAQDIVDTVKRAKHFPADLTLKDLEQYTAKIRPVPCITYHNFKLCSMAPPSSGGVTIMQALKILERFHLYNEEPFSNKSVHLMATALRLAYADRNKYIADPDFVSVPTRLMLEENYLLKRSELIDPEKLLPHVSAGDPSVQMHHFASLKMIEPPSTT